jgi:hypothetical protein
VTPPPIEVSRGGPVVAPPRSRPADGRWAVLEGMMLLAGVVLRTMLPFVTPTFCKNKIFVQIGVHIQL